MHYDKLLFVVGLSLCFYKTMNKCSVAFNYYKYLNLDV